MVVAVDAATTVASAPRVSTTPTKQQHQQQQHQRQRKQLTHRREKNSWHKAIPHCLEGRSGILGGDVSEGDGVDNSNRTCAFFLQGFSMVGQECQEDAIRTTCHRNRGQAWGAKGHMQVEWSAHAANWAGTRLLSRRVQGVSASGQSRRPTTDEKGKGMKKREGGRESKQAREVLNQEEEEVNPSHHHVCVWLVW